MAIVWSIVILSSAFSVGYFQYRNESSLYQITHVFGDVDVIRDGQTQTIPFDDLVPGDVMLVHDGDAYCDMVLVAAGYTLVDESALTGEATPVGKTAIDPTIGRQTYSTTGHKRHTIMAGTSILECDNTRAIVLNTASYTARGEMIRDIYSYKRHQFKFDMEVPIVISLLFCYALFGFV